MAINLTQDPIILKFDLDDPTNAHESIKKKNSFPEDRERAKCTPSHSLYPNSRVVLGWAKAGQGAIIVMKKASPRRQSRKNI